MKREIEALSEDSVVQDNRLFLSKIVCVNSRHLAMLTYFINKDKAWPRWRCFHAAWAVSKSAH